MDSEFVTIKTPEEIEKMRVAGRASADALRFAVALVKPGISTWEIDRLTAEFIMKNGWIAASKGYRGFPNSICTSVNNVVCHGIPRHDEILKEGDIINIDVAVIVDGWYGDNSITVPVGDVSYDAMRIMSTCAQALRQATNIVKPGVRFREIGTIIEAIASSQRCSTVREYVGHGIGRFYHEPPEVFHFKNNEPTIRMQPGMVFTIEPMLNIGSALTDLDPHDGWTVRTRDGSLSAQFEHTILVTETGHEILTAPPER